LAGSETFPTETLLRLARTVLDRDGSLPLEYFDPRVGYEEMVYGYRRLRQLLAERTNRMQSKNVDHRGVLLTSGAVQAISLAAHAYIDPGDIVVVEQVTFPYAVRYFESRGAEVRSVPIDYDGMNVDALEELVEMLAHERRVPKMVYLGPTYHCPTGSVLSLERRHALVRLAQKHGFLILEDDVYSDLGFSESRIPTLMSLDDSGLVIQCGTFSKIVAPGLRLGWIMGTPEAITPVAGVRQDLGVSQWLARIMEMYLEEGYLEPHIANVRRVYQAKAEAAVEGLASIRDDLVRFDTPRGSFYLWIEIDERVDWSRVTAEAARAGIHFRAGEKFFMSDDPRQFFRMSYSQEPLERVREGAARLGEIIRRAARAPVSRVG
jgi:2-aminoadipate transaminase